MNKVLSAQHITKSYGKKQVLHDVSLEIEPGVIYGLIGRNGAGKTTLLSILTAQNTWDAGTVTYGGEPVWENARALADICFSRELSPMMMFGENTYKVRDYLKAAATYYPHWDEAYAQKLVQRFGLETKKRISHPSPFWMNLWPGWTWWPVKIFTNCFWKITPKQAARLSSLPTSLKKRPMCLKRLSS